MKKEFNIGDEVVWNGRITADGYTIEETAEKIDFLKSKKTHIIAHVFHNGCVELEGNEKLMFDPDIFIDNKLHLDEKPETNFKVGDWVKSKQFKGVGQITSIEGNSITIGGITPSTFKPEELQLVCGFKKGELIKVSNDDKNCDTDITLRFHSYDPELDYPFIVEKYKGEVGSYRYAKQIPNKKYKPYLQPKFEWIFEKPSIKFKIFEGVHKIQGINEKGVFIENDVFISFESLFYNYTWLDGSPCGELNE